MSVIKIKVYVSEHLSLERVTYIYRVLSAGLGSALRYIASGSREPSQRVKI